MTAKLLFDDMDEAAAQAGGNVLPDPTTDFKVRADQIARRRALANQMVAQAARDNGGSGMAGGVYMVGNQWGNVARDLGGAVLSGMADKQEAENVLQQRMAQNDFSTRYQSAPDDATRQSLLTEARDKGLKYDLEQAFRKEEADRIERGEQLAATREATAAEKEANRAFLASQGELNRQNRLDVRQAPTIHISQGGGRGGVKAPSGYRYNEDGTALEPIPGGPAGAKALTEAQGNAYLFGTRADQAHKILGEVGTDYSPMKVSIAGAMDKVPGVNAGANALLSDNEQKVAQAQRDFVNAVLRKESGAAISQSEFDNARKQYFPQPGDSTKVIEQKTANRETAIKGLAKIVGPQGKDIGKPTTPKVVRTGILNGRKVEQLSDGTTRYAD
jgi:hypothetical protein